MITDCQITALRAEASAAGDLDQVAICDHALGVEPAAPYVVRDDGRLWLSDYARVLTREQARYECARVVRYARNQTDYSAC